MNRSPCVNLFKKTLDEIKTGSVANMDLGLPLSSGCDETHQVPLRLSVKEKDIKEEEYGHMITCQDDEEKPIADLHCKTETDLSESLSSTYNETLQTTVDVKVKKEEGEQQHNDCPLETLRLRHELEMTKLKVEWQQEMLKEVTKERDFLREQLAMTVRKKDKSVRSEDSTNALKQTTSGASATSSSDSSDSSSDSSSADEERKKKKKNSKTVKRRKQGKRGKKRQEQSIHQRARDPEEVVARYKKVLKIYQRGKTMVAAFRAVGVDRNTIVVNAPIAELFIAAPEKFAALKEKSPKKEKLICFAQMCKDAIEADDGIDKTIKYYKESGKLLPINKGK
ncbi:coiled-coil domain-containing protein 106-like [Clupea harengus]|uniref:Coiled-coil domain-containing protein 106-like n=1 Tax=Clupea harengus TaxID=7950 RepID=A0A6P8ETN7_CLUHA|nr:coiled-coil domain-containing protein 106-like [Clupea harengus]